MGEPLVAETAFLYLRRSSRAQSKYKLIHFPAVFKCICKGDKLWNVLVAIGSSRHYVFTLCERPITVVHRAWPRFTYHAATLCERPSTVVQRAWPRFTYAYIDF